MRLSGQWVWLEGSRTKLWVHDPSVCVGNQCSVHNRTDHAMRSFPQVWRSDRRIMERACPHGVGHPDPDDFRVRTGLDDGMHGCDGCCRERR